MLCFSWIKECFHCIRITGEQVGKPCSPGGFSSTLGLVSQTWGVSWPALSKRWQFLSSPGLSRRWQFLSWPALPCPGGDNSCPVLPCPRGDSSCPVLPVRSSCLSQAPLALKSLDLPPSFQSFLPFSGGHCIALLPQQNLLFCMKTFPKCIQRIFLFSSLKMKICFSVALVQ